MANWTLRPATRIRLGDAQARTVRSSFSEGYGLKYLRENRKRNRRMGQPGNCTLKKNVLGQDLAFTTDKYAGPLDHVS
jgi:hypothetical protein